MKKDKEISTLKKNIEDIVVFCCNNQNLRLQDIEHDIDFSVFKKIKHTDYKLTKDTVPYDDAMMTVCGKKFYWYLKVSTVLKMLEVMKK